jgi:hypothetical protein
MAFGRNAKFGQPIRRAREDLTQTVWVVVEWVVEIVGELVRAFASALGSAGT